MPPGYTPPEPSIPPVIDESLKSLTNAEIKEKILAIAEKMIAMEVDYHRAPFAGNFAADIRNVQDKI